MIRPIVIARRCSLSPSMSFSAAISQAHHLPSRCLVSSAIYMGGRSIAVRNRPQQRMLVTCLSSGAVVVVGGGASGLTAALYAAQSGAKVTVLERTKECGKKILMSGGSRCNVLPLQYTLDGDYFSESSTSALRRVFASWSIEECKSWLESPDGVALKLGLEEETNKYFPTSNSSKEVRDNLVAACEKSGVDIQYNMKIDDIRQLPGGGWQCIAAGAAVDCERLIISTGGLSFPKVGTDGTGHRFMEKLGHTLGKGIYPALTPIVADHPAGKNLAGVSLYSVALECVGPEKKKKKKKKKATGAMRTGLLFTHRGYSGPSVLDLSHLAVQALERGDPAPVLRVNWTGEELSVWEERLRQGGPSTVLGMMKKSVPQRLAEALCEEAGISSERRLSEIRKEERIKLLELVSAYKIPYTGHQGYPKAEVTGGGIPLSEINCATMESKVLPGLFLCGEICDVFGRIGGFNFYWAWLSGRLAGISAAKTPPPAAAAEADSAAAAAGGH